MAANELHVAMVGVPYELAIEDEGGPLDLSGSSVRNLRFQKPDGTLLVVDAALVAGEDSIMNTLHYVLRDGDVDQEGTWRVQGYFEIGPEHVFTDVQKFKVKPNLPLG